MTASSNLLRRARPVRQEAETHLFAVGAAVRLKGGYGSLLKSAEIYHVTATLPPRGNSLQYRIRNDEERYERVATQDDLEAVAMLQPTDNAALVERTFGNG
jgi:hypothetical protein